MKGQILKILFFVLVVVVGFEIGHYSWEFINLPFSNPLGLTGPLTLSQFNPLNNLVRYVFFVSAPSLLLLLLYGFSKRLRTQIQASHYRNSEEPTSPYFFRITMTVYSLWLLIETLRFLSPPFNNSLDIFHEGELLAPAWNFKETGGIWTKSFFIHGALYDVFTPIFAWKIFGSESIGANRLMIAILQYSVFPAVALFFMFTARFAAKKKSYDWLLLIGGLLAMWSLSIDVVQMLDRRDVVVLLGLISFLVSVKKMNRTFAALAGLAVPFSFFYTIDRGAYLLALLLAGLVFLTLLSLDRATLLKRLVAPLVSGIFFGFFFLFLIVGGDEFSAFLNMTAYFYKAKDLFDSYLFPLPFVDLQNSKSRPLLLIGIQLFGFTYFLLRDYVAGRNLNSGLIQLLFVGAAVFYFRSALGRSDDYHFAYASSFTYLGIALLIWLWCRDLPERVKPVLIGILLLASLGGLSKRAFADKISLMSSQAPSFEISWKSIFEFPSRLKDLVNAPDEYFLVEGDTHYLGNRYRQVLPWLHDQFADEKCFFSFTNEPSLSFLLKKPTCSRHYIVWFASATHLQKEIVRDLETSSPGLLLYRSPSSFFNMDDIDSIERLPLVNDYITQNYLSHERRDGWEVWKKRKVPVTNP